MCLFRLALAWGTTYQTIMQVNQLDSEDLGDRTVAANPRLRIRSAPSSQSAIATEAPVTPGAVEISSEEEAEASGRAKPELEPSSQQKRRGRRVHVVSAGETDRASISLRYRVDVNELIELNEITDRNRLRVGQELKAACQS